MSSADSRVSDLQPDGQSRDRRPFGDRLQEAIDRKKSCLVVGLDPVVDKLPPEIHRQVRGQAGDRGWTAHAAAAVALFHQKVIEVVSEHAVAVKPNTAFFECMGPVGWDALCSVAAMARDAGLIVISDAKRGDIGHTAHAYAEALLGEIPDTLGPSTDAVTIQPYLGSDGVEPFLERCDAHGKGVFVLVRTSNPSGSELQELDVGGEKLYERVAHLVHEWGRSRVGESGLHPVGAVVGATAPEQGARIREILPTAFFLVPGFGAQGAGAKQLRPMFLSGGRGVVVNASRSIVDAHLESDVPWPDAIEQAARQAREQLEAVRAST